MELIYYCAISLNFIFPLNIQMIYFCFMLSNSAYSVHEGLVTTYNGKLFPNLFSSNNVCDKMHDIKQVVLNWVLNIVMHWPKCFCRKVLPCNNCILYSKEVSHYYDCYLQTWIIERYMNRWLGIFSVLS